MIERPLYLNQIMPYVNTPFVKILSSIRRSGKSTILKMIMERLEKDYGVSKEQIVACRFDSMEYAPIDDPKQEMTNYIRLGGFPGTHVQLFDQEEIYQIVRDIYNSTVFTDIVRRNRIRKVDQLERVVKYAFNNVGNTFSAKSVSDYLKSEHRSMDNETVYGYLEKLEKAFLLHRCSIFDLQGKEILKTQEKFYLADTALRYAVLGYNDMTIASSLENVVYLELCRRGYKVYIGKDGDGEIDFVAERQNEKMYIQVTQEIKSEKTEEREYKRLLDIKDNYPKYVLRTDSFSGGNYDGIKTMHVADFLLSKDYKKGSLNSTNSDDHFEPEI